MVTIVNIRVPHMYLERINVRKQRSKYGYVLGRDQVQVVINKISYPTICWDNPFFAQSIPHR
jgi:hypothetical protein